MRLAAALVLVLTLCACAALEPVVPPVTNAVTATTTPKPSQKQKAKPKPKPKVTAKKKPTHYRNCAAVRRAGAAPIHRGEPGYGRHLDRDGDGTGCEFR